MKIVHSIKNLNFSSGGPVRAIIDLSTKLAERGHDVTILTTQDTDAPEEWKSNPQSNPRTVVIGDLALKGLYANSSQRKIIADTVNHADLVHAHGLWTPQAKRVTDAARKAGVPYIISLRGMLDDWCMEQRTTKKLVYLKLGGSRMLNGAAAIHSTAEGELAQSKKWFPGAPGIIIPNLLNLDPYEQRPGKELAREKFPFFDSGDPVLLYLSRLHYKKGVEHLIDAVEILRKQGNPHRLIVAGTGDVAYEASLKSQTTRLGLDEYVAFVGLVVGEEKISLYQAADLFVLPTSQENFGFVLYESLAAGTTLLTTKGVDTWPELQNQAQSTICDQEANAIAESVAKLTSNPAELEEKGKIGRKWIFDEMNPDQIILRFEDMYNQVLSGSSE
ncbi:MAG: glycosyltransferase [Phycisphaerales bacterium]